MSIPASRGLFVRAGLCKIDGVSFRFARRS